MSTANPVSAADPQLIIPDWPAPPGVRAAFTLRTGGVSNAPYDSLNLGTSIGDTLEAVVENRRRVRQKLQLPGEPSWLDQVHGVEVVVLGADGFRAVANPPSADASVTWSLGQVCAIRVADCMPVLFAARDGSAVAAAHAGWRGLAGGVLEKTVERLGIAASQLMAWMGPAIGPEHFEVGDEVREAFCRSDPGAESAFMANARGRLQCDLYMLARRRLDALGVSGIYGGGWCTFADSERFFSYRRSSRCGRMAALVWMESERKAN